MNDAYGSADIMRQAAGRTRTAGRWSTEVAGDSAASPVAEPPLAAAAAPDTSGVRRLSEDGSAYMPTPDSGTSLRLVQVYLTPGIDEFLRQARSMAIVQNIDVTASAVVRHAMERLMAAASPADIVDLLGSPKGQSQPKRGRPRR
jgi:hypothetical protein